MCLCVCVCCCWSFKCDRYAAWRRMLWNWFVHSFVGSCLISVVGCGGAFIRPLIVDCEGMCMSASASAHIYTLQCIFILPTISYSVAVADSALLSCPCLCTGPTVLVNRT